jgi:hypothetical protein
MVSPPVPLLVSVGQPVNAASAKAQISAAAGNAPAGARGPKSFYIVYSLLWMEYGEAGPGVKVAQGPENPYTKKAPLQTRKPDNIR